MRPGERLSTGDRLQSCFDVNLGGASSQPYFGLLASPAAAASWARPPQPGVIGNTPRRAGEPRRARPAAARGVLCERATVADTPSHYMSFTKRGLSSELVFESPDADVSRARFTVLKAPRSRDRAGLRQCLGLAGPTRTQCHPSGRNKPCRAWPACARTVRVVLRDAGAADVEVVTNTSPRCG